MPYLGASPKETFTATSSQVITGNGGTSYSLNTAVVNPEDLEVFINNVQQQPTTTYTVSGATITFDQALNSTDTCYVIFRGAKGESRTHPAGSNITAADAAVTGAATVTGDLTVDTNTLKVDSSNNRVGIGTASPTVPLQVAGDIKESVSGANAQISAITDGAANYATFTTTNGSRSYSMQIRPDQSNAFVVRDETSGANRLLINTSGHVIKPNTPFFEVHTVPNSHANGNVVDFTSITSNVGGHWDNTNNRFTAPVAGVYQFNFSVFTHRTTNTGDYYWDLRKNASVILRAYDAKDAGQNRHCQIMASAAMFLNVNDYIDLHFAVGPTGMEASGSHNRFSGFLVG